jgi:D-alanyl-D-alanine-carboxypeptidase/D-alanyl-D-alanine-endopeptidase
MTILEHDLEAMFRNGVFGPPARVGVAIGIGCKGTRRLFSYGTAQPDSFFEIGSVTKAFTGLVFAQMIQQGQVEPDLAVRNLLPTNTVRRPHGCEISLLDLATQHSGLPRIPGNLRPADANDPYADYPATDLYRFIAHHGVGKPANAPFIYSNLGYGLLGQALANRAGVPYAQLLEQAITQPLGLRDTVIELSPQQQTRFIQGHTQDYRHAHTWAFGALAGAGAIRSTARDMLTYLEANLHPENLVSSSPAGSSYTLPQAIALSHELRNAALPGMHISFAWLHEDSTGTYWLNGATGGYTSFVCFNPRKDYAVVVLFNRTIGSRGSLADWIGQYLSSRLAGSGL